jgi:hypothetical protein
MIYENLWWVIFQQLESILKRGMSRRYRYDQENYVGIISFQAKMIREQCIHH